MNNTKNPKVCIIGAGPSGITAAKHLKQVGITNFIVYDKNDQVGGNWIFKPDPSHSSVYETAHIISSKRLSEYHDFPMPKDYPDYPNHNLLLKYFHDYAEHFGIMENIQFNTEVKQTIMNKDYSWTVELESGQKEVFEYLIIASGHHWNPRMPELKGDFDGKIIHSHFYKGHLPYKGKKVLIIGGGNSACDIAVDISRYAEKTSISWRRGYYVVPKLVFGVPPDVFSLKAQFLPRWLRKRLFKLTWKLTVGSNEKYGLQKPDHYITEAHPILNTQFLNHLRHGDISPRRDIKEISGSEVKFVDGLKEEYDVIRAGTGYLISFPYLHYEEFNFENKIVDLFLKMFHPKFPTLGIIGLVQPQGCIWPLSDTQAQIFANYIAGNYSFPKNIEKRIKQEVTEIKNNFIDSPRHSTEVEYHSFQKKLFKEVPKNAPSWK